jgi:uncharacterized protein YaaW (UPF0174 family)
MTHQSYIAEYLKYPISDKMDFIDRVMARLDRMYGVEWRDIPRKSRKEIAKEAFIYQLREHAEERML